MLDKKWRWSRGQARESAGAVAVELAKKGVHVIINYNGSKDKAEETREMILGSGNSAEIYPCNVSDFSLCQEMFTSIIKSHGRLDILVNNAGITRDGLLMRMSEEDFDKVIETNLKGTFNCMRFASRQMLKAKKRAGGQYGLRSQGVGNAGQANYSRLKSRGYWADQSGNQEMASRGVRVNAVAPGFIATDMTGVLSDEVKEKAAGQIPMGKIWDAGRYCPCCGISDFRRKRLYHRPGHPCGRRHGHLGGSSMKRRVVITGMGAITPRKQCGRVLEKC